ncbi:LysR family transcriptional regulator [Frisingicoccus sp.]|uniref:LysR family transcriptional regulator n=1 Tax=Frisingicoccus sp. TaxID=1918627 RepID=UPI003AB2AB20
MEYRQLYYFVCVCKEGNYSKAADKICVSQSVLTRAVQSLEKEFDVQLIKRSTRSFELTEIGNKFYERAEKVVSSFETLQTDMYEYADIYEGKRIRFGIPSVLNTIMAPFFVEFIQDDYLRFKMDFSVEGSRLLEQKVWEESLDVALVMQKPEIDDKFDVWPILSDKLAVIVRSDNELAQKEEISIEELKDEYFVLIDPSYQLYENIIQMCKNVGFTPNIFQESPNWDYISSLVLLSQGVSILPRPIMEVADKQLVAIPLTGELAEWKIAAITKKGKKVSKSIKKLIKYIQRYYM